MLWILSQPLQLLQTIRDKMTILLSPEALAQRIIGLENLIKEKDESYRDASKIEAAALENRIKQEMAKEYAFKSDLNSLRDKISETPNRVELLAAITVTSAIVSAVITIMMRFLGPKGLP